MLTYPLGLLAKKKAAVDNSFKLTIDTSLGTGNTFTLPLPIGFSYDFWWSPGDGSPDLYVNAYNSPNITYDYGVPFAGQISIGTKAGDVCEAWSFNNSGDKLKVFSIDQWGYVGFYNLNRAFHGCTNLINLTSHITGAENVSDFSLIFFGCTSFTELPELLFSECTSATIFTQAFRSCFNLVTIPSNIFNNCIQVINLTSIFQTAAKIVTIPIGLFDPLVNLENASGMFTNCYLLENIPADMFRYNTKITTFNSLFYQCYNLSAIPNNLFYYNSLVTNYAYAFSGCRNISLPSTLFNLSNLSIVTAFNYFMDALSTSYSNTGSIQDIWNYATSATSTNAFLNQTTLTNYASIPNNWKGL